VKTTLFVFLIAGFAFGQEPTADAKQRARSVRELGKQGQDAIPKIAPFVGDTDLNVRIEAVM